MNVLIPNLHGILTVSFCRAFGEIGADVFVPAVDDARQARQSRYRSPLAGAYDFRKDLDRERPKNCRIVDLEALPELDIDLVLVTGHGVQRSVLKYLLPLLGRRRRVDLAYFCGNELPRYRWDLVRNLLCADELSWRRHGSATPNATRYYPWIDYQRFSWQGPSDARKIVSCIGNYDARYPEDAAFARRLVASVPGLQYELIDAIGHDRIAEHFRQASATLHIKPEEGYGYAVIESLACGRPVIAPRKYIRGRAMQHWCLDGDSALLYDTFDEARQALMRFLDDPEFRTRLQTSAAATVRRIIDNDEQNAVLKRFVERLQPQADKTLLSRLLDVRHRHR
ncbi:MAG: glycosyltransferase [Burkholderiaceae bacterium]|nr:glycosyltransferase [Burkholderiaceae bacterium]